MGLRMKYLDKRTIKSLQRIQMIINKANRKRPRIHTHREPNTNWKAKKGKSERTKRLWWAEFSKLTHILKNKKGPQHLRTKIYVRFALCNVWCTNIDPSQTTIHKLQTMQ